MERTHRPDPLGDGRTPRRRRLAVRLLAVLAVAALLAAGCGDDDDGGDETSTGDTEAPADATVEVSDPWSRATAPTADRGAAYLVLEAVGSDDALIGASVDPSIAGTVEIHETVAADGSDDMGSDDMGSDGSGSDDMGSDGSGSDDMDDMSDDTGSDGSGSDDMGSDDMDDMSDDTGMDGSMTMRPIDQLDLPAGEQVVLEPGGYHIMLLDLPEPLVAGESYELTLQFENAGTQTVTVEVREA